MSEIETTPKAAPPSHGYDYQRAYRIRTGQQSALDVPLPVLRDLVTGSAHARDALTEALGERTVAALTDEPAQRAS